MILNDAYVVAVNGDWPDFFDFVRHSRCVLSCSKTRKSIHQFSYRRCSICDQFIGTTYPPIRWKNAWFFGVNVQSFSFFLLFLFFCFCFFFFFQKTITTYSVSIIFLTFIVVPSVTAVLETNFISRFNLFKNTC